MKQFGQRTLKYTVYLFMPQHVSGIGQRFHGNINWDKENCCQVWGGYSE